MTFVKENGEKEPLEKEPFEITDQAEMKVALALVKETEEWANNRLLTNYRWIRSLGMMKKQLFEYAENYWFNEAYKEIKGKKEKGERLSPEEETYYKSWQKFYKDQVDRKLQILINEGAVIINIPPDGDFKFSKDEFKGSQTPEILRQAMSNELLRLQDLYKVMNKAWPIEGAALFNRLNKGQSLNLSEIEHLNRLLIGMNYPLEGPMESLNALLQHKNLYQVMPVWPIEVKDLFIRLNQGQPLNSLETQRLNRLLIKVNDPSETPESLAMDWRNVSAEEIDAWSIKDESKVELIHLKEMGAQYVYSPGGSEFVRASKYGQIVRGWYQIEGELIEMQDSHMEMDPQESLGVLRNMAEFNRNPYLAMTISNIMVCSIGMSAAGRAQGVAEGTWDTAVLPVKNEKDTAGFYGKGMI